MNSLEGDNATRFTMGGDLCCSDGMLCRGMIRRYCVTSVVLTFVGSVISGQIEHFAKKKSPLVDRLCTGHADLLQLM